MFAGAASDALHLLVEFGCRLDQLRDPQEMLKGGPELVRRMDRQLFAAEEQAEQLTGLEQAALAVLAWDDDGAFER